MAGLVYRLSASTAPDETLSYLSAVGAIHVIRCDPDLL